MKRKGILIPPPSRSDHDSVRPCRLLIHRASQDKREPRHHHRDTANRRELAELAVAAERVRVAGAREEERPGCEESSGERRPLERRRERQHRTVDHVVLVGVLKCNLAVGVNFESMRAVSSEPNGGAAGDPGDAHDDGGSGHCAEARRPVWHGVAGQWGVARRRGGGGSCQGKHTKYRSFFGFNGVNCKNRITSISSAPSRGGRPSLWRRRRSVSSRSWSSCKRSLIRSTSTVRFCVHLCLLCPPDSPLVLLRAYSRCPLSHRSPHLSPWRACAWCRPGAAPVPRRGLLCRLPRLPAVLERTAVLQVHSLPSLSQDA